MATEKARLERARDWIREHTFPKGRCNSTDELMADFALSELEAAIQIAKVADEIEHGEVKESCSEVILRGRSGASETAMRAALELVRDSAFGKTTVQQLRTIAVAALTATQK